MIYLKRFLYILVISIFYILVTCTTFLYLGLTPIGMIISFILTEDFIRFFMPLTELERYTKLIDDKLEYIFLK